jgi:transcriptional regulator with XRE-family HTH domain
MVSNGIGRQSRLRKNTIWRIENGKCDPSTTPLIGIAAAFGISEERLTLKAMMDRQAIVDANDKLIGFAKPLTE